ncbi:MAG: tRNA (adenosine(37)-N6)-threonylcarbamoyltransferase complex dimerization subunit type 1 TsaB [Chitinophagales bacterium]|nr:tRNA (adenosine(37)-N6)-threonylcarbamoyltransferase complex dimerization subunit type 1 TsaB [Chitinophagales bacterium]MDW8273046.1 tRNA (adenosine(37)-N6)-threonylcarbamoyltransferase complex dimerization subunit type 1 TsaB [Chitinophagales bacterium]
MHTLILCIETATDVCSVCLAKNDEPIAIAEEITPNSHARLLAPMIQQTLHKADVHIQQLGAVCVSMGPGSYTGLRIGFALAKAICYAQNIPMITVSTLHSIAYGIRPHAAGHAVLLPALDAKRDDAYFCILSNNIEELHPPACKSVSYIHEWLREKNLSAIAGGPGAHKLKSIDLPIQILTNPVVSARFLAPLAYAKFHSNEFSHTAYCEPLYL